MNRVGVAKRETRNANHGSVDETRNAKREPRITVRSTERERISESDANGTEVEDTDPMCMRRGGTKRGIVV